MKIKSTVNYGHHFKVLGKLLVIPAGMVMEITKEQLTALQENAVYNAASKSGALEIAGKKKIKKKEEVPADGMDSHADE